jgi:hypothetical protein
MTIRQTMPIINKMASISWSISKQFFSPDARTFHDIYKLQEHVRFIKASIKSDRFYG